LTTYDRNDGTAVGDVGNVNGAMRERRQGGCREIGQRGVDVLLASTWPRNDDAHPRARSRLGGPPLPSELLVVDRQAGGAAADRAAGLLDVVDVDAGPHITVRQDREKGGS
jgi:hypothetical protein